MKLQNKINKFCSLLGFILILTNFNILPSLAQKKCGNTEVVEASKTTRTLELKKFGIKVKIPSNYRTMLRNDGSIRILDPSAFEATKCAAPHGIYFFDIKLVPNSKKLSLLELAKSSYTKQEGANMKLHNYNINNIEAVLIDSEGGYGAYGIFKAPGVNGVVEMSAGCDCEVDKTDIIRYLEVTELLN